MVYLDKCYPSDMGTEKLVKVMFVKWPERIILTQKLLDAQKCNYCILTDSRYYL